MTTIVHYMFKRERALLRCKRSRLWFMCVYPFIIMGLLWTIFYGKVLTQIPVAVVNNSPGTHGREMVRELTAQQFLNVALFPSLPKGLHALQSGRVYGVISVEPQYDRDLLKRAGAQVSAWVNNEYLLIGGNLNKGINSVVGRLNARYQRQNLAALGVPGTLHKTLSAPLTVSETVLYNPPLNYVHFLGLGLLPAVLQLFVCLSVAYSLLWDIKTRRAKRLRRAFTTHPYLAAGSKIVLYMGVYTAVILGMLGILVLGFDLPVQGSWGRIALGVVAFVFLTACTALLFAALTNNLRLAISVCAMYAAPAFAYYGVSFPIEMMPLAARMWAELMPGTHLNRLFVNEFLRGANAGGSWGEIAFMLGVGAVFFWLGSKGYAHWTKQDKYLGPKL